MLNLLDKPTEINCISYKNQEINIIRLDQNDSKISGNKWLKLSQNITDSHHTYASFGGPHSNHLHAFSYACKKLNKKHVVFVRGIGPKDTPTLLDIQKNNGLIVRLSKKDYAKKHQANMQTRWKNLYGDMHFIPEGGNNELAEQSCATWFKALDIEFNAVVALSIGTGCTFKGVAKGLQNKQTLVGLPAFYMHDEMKSDLLSFQTQGELEILNAQKQERFAKISQSQWQTMLDFEAHCHIALDPVYTGKTLFRLLEHLHRYENRPVYFIHTGGLQGRRVYQQQYS